MRTASSSDSAAPALAAEGLSAGYGGAAGVLRGVRLEVRRGEMVVVIGPNGAGKSTLLRALAGTLSPREGRVRLFGEDLADLRREAVARRLAVVHATTEVPEGVDVTAAVMMGRAPHQGPLCLASEHDRGVVRGALSRVGIAALARRRLTELSAGELQLVAAARALAQEPEVMLLDEASAHLDVRHALALYDCVRAEVESRAVACVAVVHDLHLAATYADRVVLLVDGRVAADGAIEEVMTYQRLRDAFEVDLYVGVNELDGVRYFLPRRGAR